MGWLKLIVVVGLATLCISTEDSSKDKILIRRKRFNWGVVIQTVSLATGTVTVSLSIADYMTDGAVFYPSINEAKKVVKEKKKWIDANRDVLKNLRKNYQKSYETYTDTKIHSDTYMKAKSIVMQQLQHESFAIRKQKYLSDNLLAASFLENGIKIPNKNTSFAVSQDVQKALFWTGTSLNILMQAYSATKLVETLRMGRVIAKQAATIKDINEFLDSDGYRPGRKLPGPPRQATSAPGKVSRIRRLGNWMKKKYLPKAFRSKTYLQTHNGDIDENVGSLSANKVAVGLAMISLGLQTAGTVLQVLGAKAKKVDWDNNANAMTTQVVQLKKTMREWPEQEKTMRDLTDDMANIVQYLLEQDGVMCDVSRDNILPIVKTLKDRTVETLRGGERYMARYQGIKDLIMMSGSTDAKYLYNRLVNQLDKGDMKEEIVHLLKKGGLTVGTWNNWKGKGACVSECGISHRRMTRTCATGDNCLGISEGTEICEPFMLNKAEFDACERHNNRKTLNLPDVQDPLRFALPVLCNKSRYPTFDYYTITNKHTGLVMAVNQDNIEQIMVEEKNLSPNSNHNQLWRKEHSTKDDHAMFVSKFYGRTLKVQTEMNKTIFDWKVSPQGRVEGHTIYLTVDDISCAASSRERSTKTVPNAVVYKPKRSTSKCQQWDMSLVDEDSFELTTLSPEPNTSTTTALSAPINIKEFLKRHNLDHLYSNFLDNGIDLDFVPLLTMDEMKQFGINSARDRIMLSRAAKLLL
eukprot:GFUD01006359.1.p1 GENE.GFUD01006359.1~~GFUD01006359.1.p1  ORF type:complete len:750 (-),score=140.26 GFUD01006359.1:700-2949(-)